MFSWEIKSVNAKGLDLRLRVPPGFDSLEVEARARLSRKLARGTVYATLAAQKLNQQPILRINEPMLQAVLDLLAKIPLSGHLKAASIDGILALKGIVETVEAADEDQSEVVPAMLAGLEGAIEALLNMRRTEGQALGAVLSSRIAAMRRLVDAADQAPARQPEAVRARLEQSLAALLSNSAFDPIRLHQEAVLMATKADIREELDRLIAHLVALRELITNGGPIGRKLDFLSQELSREVNTLCAKSNDASLTAIGLDLKTEVEQFREQVQNIE